LKEPTGWFAAGSGFQKALAILSDGSFKMFVWMCLQADRHTGQLEITHRQLARTLGKSRRAIGTYVQELTQLGFCHITAGSNQHAASRLVIADEYWPYHRESQLLQEDLRQESAFITALRENYLTLGCGRGRFSPADVRKARQWWRRGVPQQVILDALLLGACRKWLAAAMETTTLPIGSLAYFEPLLEEVSQKPLAEDYRQYVKLKLEKLASQNTPCQKSSTDRVDESGQSTASREWIQ
jgi:biotin operon repressor